MSKIITIEARDKAINYPWIEKLSAFFKEHNKTSDKYEVTIWNGSIIKITRKLTVKSKPLALMQIKKVHLNNGSHMVLDFVNSVKVTKAEIDMFNETRDKPIFHPLQNIVGIKEVSIQEPKIVVRIDLSDLDDLAWIVTSYPMGFIEIGNVVLDIYYDGETIREYKREEPN